MLWNCFLFIYTLVAFSLISNLDRCWTVFLWKKPHSTWFPHTFSWSPGARVTLPGTWRSIHSDGEQSANAMWCHSNWRQLCGEWRHADRYSSISSHTTSAGSPGFLLNDNGRVCGWYGTFLLSQLLLIVLHWTDLRVQIKADFYMLGLITGLTFWVFSISFLQKDYCNPVILKI